MNSKLTENPEIPVLSEWISLTEAAKILGLSRQYVNKRAAGGDYKTLHRLGDSPSLVVKRSEIEQIKEKRESRDGGREEPVAEEAPAITAEDIAANSVTAEVLVENSVTAETVAEEAQPEDEKDEEDDFLRDLLA